MRNNRGSSSEVGCISIGYEDTYNSPHRGYLYHNRGKKKKGVVVVVVMIF